MFELWRYSNYGDSNQSRESQLELNCQIDLLNVNCTDQELSFQDKPMEAQNANRNLVRRKDFIISEISEWYRTQ